VRDRLAQNWILIEVRGRVSDHFRPSRTLSVAKRERLFRLSDEICRRYGVRCRVELWEWLGPPPERVGEWLRFIVKVWFGRCANPQLRIYRLLKQGG